MIDRSARLMIALLVLLLIWWVLGALCRSLLTTVDLRAVRDVASERTPAQTTMAHALSLIGSGYVVFPLTLVGCAILYLVGRSRRSLAVGLGMLGAVVIANVDKLLVGRPRPPVHHLEKVTSYSFPSGHSAQAAAFVTALLLTLLSTRCPRRVKDGVAAAGFLLALGVAASRVYLGVHYPSDVIFGLALGTACVIVASHYVTGPPTGSSTPEPNASRSVAP
jgi:membrane-associated phospholipid phosphatase